MIRKKGLFWMLMLLTMVVLAGCSPKTSQPATSQPDPTSPGTSQPPQTYNSVIPFELPDLNGDLVSISDFEGKFVLINFWATWCTYCDQEMPDLQALQDKYQEDLVVLLINVQENESQIQTYLDKKGLSMLTVLDKKGEVAGRYGVTGMPASYFVTPDQRVVGFVQGMMTYDAMEQSLQYVREQYEATK